MRIISFTLVTAIMTIHLAAQEADVPTQVSPESAVSDIVQSLRKSGSRTRGGRQFWSDVRFFRAWRIQQNIFTKHFRLLDPDNRRHCHGTLDKCAKALRTVREERNLQPMSGRAVILVHGLVRSSRSFDLLAGKLESENCTVVRFEYPSTRSSIPASASCLAQVIESLEGIDTIDLVVHSMGGLVMR